MNQRIRNLASLSNLGKGRSSGQMATFLILATVMLLTFVLVTLNVGQISINRTVVSNAADSGALFMGSQLATKSRQMFEGLGSSFERCQKTGFASLIMAVVVAIAAIAATVATYGAGAESLVLALEATGNAVGTAGLMAAGAAGGAVGGGIGGGIAGTGVVSGALTGAAIGAALGGIAGATVGSPMFGVGQIAANSMELGVIMGPIGMIAGPGTAIVGALSIGSAGYNTKSVQDMQGKEIDKLMGMLNKATEHDRMRELTFFRVLTQLVDDPNISRDSNDSDGDGNTNEYVPSFQVWLYERAKGAIESNSMNGAYLEGYFMPYLKSLASWMSYFYLGQDYSGVHTPGYMETAEYRWFYDPVTGTDTIVDNGAASGDYSNDGPISAVFRGLEQHGYIMKNPEGQNVYISGPTFADYKAYLDIPCGVSGCGSMPPAVANTFDEFDGIMAGVREVTTFINSLAAMSVDERDSSWYNWLYLLYDASLDEPYDPSNLSGTYYSLLSKYAESVMRWRQDVDKVRQGLPMCGAVGPDGLYVNAPCRIDPTWSTSFDGKPRDQYTAFFMYTDYVYTLLWMTKEAIKSLSQSMLTTSSNALTNSGGINPVRYQWNDQRGEHWVSVKVGNFRVPRIDKEERGNWFSGETCMTLRDYDDSSQPNESYVEVSRFDQSKNLGVLGKWNPFNTVTKRAYYYYTCQAADGSRPGQVGLRK